MKKSTGVEIRGFIFADDDMNVGHNEFLDAFIVFIQKNGCNFSGKTVQVDEDGEYIEDIDELPFPLKN